MNTLATVSQPRNRESPRVSARRRIFAFQERRFQVWPDMLAEIVRVPEMTRPAQENEFGELISSAMNDCPLMMDLQFISCATAGAPVLPKLQGSLPCPRVNRFSLCASEPQEPVDLRRSQHLMSALTVRQVVEINLAVKHVERCLDARRNFRFDPSAELEAIAAREQRCCLILVDYPGSNKLILPSKQLFAKRVEPSESGLIDQLRNRDSPAAADTFHAHVFLRGTIDCLLPTAFCLLPTRVTRRPSGLPSSRADGPARPRPRGPGLPPGAAGSCSLRPAQIRRLRR